MKRLYAISLLLALLLFTVARAVAEGEFTLLDTRTYLLTDTYEVVNTDTQPITDVTVKLLAGGTDDPSSPNSLGASLYQQRIKYKADPKFASVSSDKLGNLIGTIHLGVLQPGERRTVSMRKLVKNSGISFAADIYTRQPDYDAFLADPANARFVQYVKPSRHIESDSQEVKDDVSHLNIHQPVVALARDIFAGVNACLTYDESPAESHQGALHAMHTRRGVCTEFAALFVAYCRSLNIPARVVTGYWLDSKVLPTMQQNVPMNVTVHLHAWPEFYLPTVGWIPAEPTFLYTLNGKRIPDYHHFAALPPTERHLVWEYGLEIEHTHDFELTYVSQGGKEVCSYKLVEQTATWMADDATL